MRYLQKNSFIAILFAITLAIGSPAFAKGNDTLYKILQNIKSNNLMAVKALINDNPSLAGKTAVLLLRAASISIADKPQLSAERVALATQYSSSIESPKDAKAAASYIETITKTVAGADKCSAKGCVEALKSIIESSETIAKSDAVKSVSPKLAAEVQATTVIAVVAPVTPNVQIAQMAPPPPPQVPPGYRLQVSNE